MVDDFLRIAREAGVKFILWQRLKQLQQQHQSERSAASSVIGERLCRLVAELQCGGLLPDHPCTLCYVGTEGEVNTQNFFGDFSQLVVPFVETISPPVLGLFRYRCLEEMEQRAFGILEPTLAWRADLSRRAAPHEIELALLPGVAFDRDGRRLGHGKGFFDRLLPQIPATTPRVALAFSWQIVDSVPVDQHDEPVHWIVTEQEIIDSRHGGAAS